MTDKFGIILLTGSPGIGKTTLVRKICKELIERHKIICNGFYTEEVRHSITRERIGFDVVTLNNKRGILARSNVNGKGPYVGKYLVHLQDFENLALPLLNPKGNQDLLIIDEIGKMELKSKKFESAIMYWLMKTFLFATIPYELRQPIALVDKLKNHPKACTIVVTKDNRDRLQKEIVENILKIINN